MDSCKTPLGESKWILALGCQFLTLHLQNKILLCEKYRVVVKTSGLTSVPNSNLSSPPITSTPYCRSHRCHQMSGPCFNLCELHFQPTTNSTPKKGGGVTFFTLTSLFFGHICTSTLGIAMVLVSF